MHSIRTFGRDVKRASRTFPRKTNAKQRMRFTLIKTNSIARSAYHAPKGHIERVSVYRNALALYRNDDALRARYGFASISPYGVEIRFAYDMRFARVRKRKRMRTEGKKVKLGVLWPERPVFARKICQNTRKLFDSVLYI